jgi:hypothetical protein
MAGGTVKARRIAAVLALQLAAFAMPAGAQPPASIATIVQFHTVCSNCHEGECSGRLSFDSGAAAARSHIERHLETKDDVHVAALFAMLRHVKENCGHNPYAGAYFVPLGKMAAGRRQITFEFDGAAEGSARIDDDRMETVADERLCGDAGKTVAFDAAADIAYFLHLKSGAATLRRIVFR